MHSTLRAFVGVKDNASGVFGENVTSSLSACEIPARPPRSSSVAVPGRRAREALNEAIPSSGGDTWRTPDARLKRVLSR
jgi:hypothetical protein